MSLGAEEAPVHVAGEVGRGITAVAVEGAIIIVQPDRAAAALQHVLEPVVERVSEMDAAWVLALIVDSIPAAGVVAINPHH